jgi:hypothetical protein
MSSGNGSKLEDCIRKATSITNTLSGDPQAIAVCNYTDQCGMQWSQGIGSYVMLLMHRLSYVGLEANSEVRW